MIAQCINYAGHVVYTDGRIYQHYELLKTCATFGAAKAWATRNRRKQLADWAAEHHKAILELRRSN